MNADSESGKKRYEDEYEGRIGQRKKKNRDVILPEVGFAGPVAADLHDGIAQEYVDADNHHAEPADHLDQRHVVFDERHDYGQRKEGYGRKDRIGARRTQPRDESCFMVTAQGALNAQHTDGPQWNGGHQSDEYAASEDAEPHKAKYVKLQNAKIINIIYLCRQNLPKMRNALLLSLASAVLLSAGWLGMSGLPLLVALVPLLVLSGRYDASRRAFWKMAGWTALALGLWSGATTWWIWYAAPIGAILSVLITVVLFGGMFMLYHYVDKRATKALSYTLLIAGWIACEYLYTVGEVSFPWLTLGNGFANDVKAVQWYDATGVFGGSLWVLLCNVLVYRAVVARRATTWIAPALVAALPLIFSLVRYYNYEEDGKELRIEIVQPNVDPYGEKFTGNPSDQTGRLIALAEQAPAEVDYIVMPETAVNDYLWEGEFEYSASLRRLQQMVRERYPEAQVVVGATTFRRYGPGEAVSPTARTRPDIDYFFDVYNSALAVDSSSTADVRHKSMLVVGVEKIPYYGLFKHLEFLIVDLGGITGQLGTDSVCRVFRHPAGAASGTGSGAAICYESVYGSYFSQFARGGAQVMFVITNDGWWRDTPGYRQHFSFSRLRAIESRRSIARSANTGISGFINQRGDVLQQLGWDELGVLNGTLKTNDHITFYALYGDYIGRLCSYVFGLCLLYFVAYRVRRRSHLVD